MRAGADALITIRPVRPSDREPIGQLLIDTQVFTNEEITVGLELIDIVLQNPLQKDYRICTAIDDKNTVAGYYCIGPTPMTYGTFDLYWIAVSPKVHNQGLGKRLLAHAERDIAASGGRLIIAETSSQPKYENTRKFYLKNEYREVARIRDYYNADDDLVVFGKYVSQSGR